jgi:hypothetical protein
VAGERRGDYQIGQQRASGDRRFGMNDRHIAFSAALFGIAMFASPPAGAGEPRAVVELFTSQGCSSCPAADKLLGELARDPSVLTLSLAVDYWDYLGWKDTLALHGHSSRERAYAEARGDREVYTPQVVVNGIVPVLGSDKSAIEAAIAQTRRSAEPLSLPVSMTIADGKVIVQVADAADAEHRSAEVWLCPVTGKVTVAVQRGENNGHTLTYTNVVRGWVKLGDWSGKAQTYTIPVADIANASLALKDIDKLSVLVQSGVTAKPGLMLGAASASLH